MIIDTKKLQKAILENKKKHNFNTDVAIFLLGISEMVGSDLGEDIIKKMAVNEKRKYINEKKIEG